MWRVLNHYQEDLEVYFRFISGTEALRVRQRDPQGRPSFLKPAGQGALPLTPLDFLGPRILPHLWHDAFIPGRSFSSISDIPHPLSFASLEGFWVCVWSVPEPELHF